jgi:hypothetical protein
VKRCGARFSEGCRGAGFIPRGASARLQPRCLANQWIAGGFLKSVLLSALAGSRPSGLFRNVVGSKARSWLWVTAIGKDETDIAFLKIHLLGSNSATR